MSVCSLKKGHDKLFNAFWIVTNLPDCPGKRIAQKCGTLKTFLATTFVFVFF